MQTSQEMAKGGTALDGTFIYFIAYATVTKYKRKPIHASNLLESFDEKIKYFFRFFFIMSIGTLIISQEHARPKTGFSF